MTWDFEEFYAWTTEFLELDLSSYKQRQLQRRITTVMENAGTDSLEAYSQLITTNPSVREKFLDYITINVTDFYRNPELFEEFEKIVESTLVPKFGPLKIWSAACSIGAEPYTLAMIAQDNKIKLKQIISGIPESIYLVNNGNTQYKIVNKPNCLFVGFTNNTYKASVNIIKKRLQ